MKFRSRIVTALGTVLFLSACSATSQIEHFRPENAAKDQKLLFSPMIRHGETLYLSGMIGLKPGTTELPDSVEEQTRNAFAAIEKTLKLADADLSHLISCTVYLADMNNYTEMNEVYGSFFGSKPPTRTTVEVAALPLGAQIEISCLGYLNRNT